MALSLYIPPCIHSPAHPLHPPPPDKPLRIQIEGPLVSIQKLLPEIGWHTDVVPLNFPLPAGPELAKLAFEKIYGRISSSEASVDMIVRDEYLGWIPKSRYIDYYGVTFDHLVPADDPDPDVLQINIIEIEDDGGAYANENLPFIVVPGEYVGQRILAVPRCCQKRKGTQDRGRINDSVLERDRESREKRDAQSSRC